MTSEAICSGAEATCEGSYSRADPAVINQTLRDEKALKPKGGNVMGRQSGRILGEKDRVGTIVEEPVLAI